MIFDYLAEQAVIGAMLIDEDAVELALGKLKPTDFGSSPCREAFTVMAALFELGESIDFITVADRCADRTESGEFLRQCAETTVTTVNTDEYISIVKKQAAARRVAAIGDKLTESTLDGFRAEAATGMEELQGVLDETASADVVNAEAWADAFAEEQKAIIEDPTSAYCATGWSDLDNILGGGFLNAGLYIMGARPGMGKTTVALNIAEQVASKGMPVLFVSLEMTSRQVMCKRIAAKSGIPYRKLISGDMTWDEQIDMDETLTELRTRPLNINNRFGLTVTDIASMARQVRGCRLVVIDYFGLISTEGEVKGRYEDYTLISGRLKQLACQLNVPILCLAQLNRNTESRQNKRPQLADLRDTGAIEQDADGVIFLHRDGYYNEASPGGNIELILAKNRHGNTGSILLYWDGELSRVAMLRRGND